jgi:uncharacterized protein involved in exopolysaccharide biosynthesis
MTQHYDYAMDIEDYLDILHRRKWLFLMTFISILTSGIVIAFILPPVYKSEATIIIERQEIPTELVATTVTGYVQERIEGIRQRLVTYNNLVDIEKELNIFPEMRKAGDISEMVTLIKESISVEMVDVKATTAKGGSATATIAFTVGYQADTAETAQKVAAALAERYLKENKLARSEQAAEVSEFLGVEADRLKKEIVELEKSLALFKQEKQSELPELMQVNMRLYEKTEGQIEASRDRILKLEDTKTALESELSLTDPRRAVTTDEGKIIQSPDERLNVLVAEFLQSSARYTSSHPDIVRLRREIKVLGGQSNQAAKVNKLVSNITRLRNKLLEAKQKYAEDHPDILSLEKSITAVETGLRNIDLTGTTYNKTSRVPPDNPRYVALKTQLDAAISNLREEKSKLRQYNEKLAQYEKRLFQTPVVERDYKSLSRDYANAQNKYADLKNKQIQARLAEQVEAGEKAERFVLAGGAYLPSSPDSPNRLGIVLLAGLLAMSGGVGNIAMAEYKDRSVRGTRGVFKLFGALPIAVIPYIDNAVDRSKRVRRRLRKLAVLLLIIIIVMTGVHVFLKPLDELWAGPQSEVKVPVEAVKQNEN